MSEKVEEQKESEQIAENAPNKDDDPEDVTKMDE